MHLLALLAALVTVVALLVWTRGQEQLTSVVVAGSQIPEGTLVSDGSLTLVEIPAAASVAEVMVPGEERVTLVGQVTTRTIAAGEPLLRSDVRAPVDLGGRRQMSVPISEAYAVGGSLVAGDQVDAMVVTDIGSRFVAQQLTVLAVRERATEGFAASSADWWVVVAVTDVEALEIGDALENGTLHLLRSTGTPELTVTELSPEPEPQAEVPGESPPAGDG